MVQTRVLGKALIIEDRRRLVYRLEIGEPFTYLAGVPRSRRELTDDPTVTAYLERTLEPGNLVVDIGASIGAIAMPAGRLVGEKGRVLAIEAEKVNFEQLCGNIALNRLAQVEAHHLAIAAHSGTVVIHVYPRSNRGWHSIGRREGEGVAPLRTETVACMTIDDFLTRHAIACVDLLKIDIEGAEPEAFAGAARSLACGAIRRIIFELSREPLRGMGHEIDDVLRPLVAAGYAIRSIRKDGMLAEASPASVAKMFFANLVALAPGSED